MRFVAVLMVIVGVLVAGLSGLCTAGTGLAAMAQLLGRRPARAFPVLALALIVGGPFIAAGIALLRWGL